MERILASLQETVELQSVRRWEGELSSKVIVANW